MNNMKTTICAAIIGLGLAGSALAGNITIRGSDTIVILAQKWAEVYMSKNPSTKIQVTGGGSGIGMAALQNGATDIANSSRKMKPAEIATFVTAFSRRPTEYKVCMDGLSVYVHESSPVKELTLAQLQGIFTGKIKNWKDVGGPDARIIVYSRENSSGTYEFFKEHVLEGKDFSPRAQTMPGTAAIIEAVAKEKNGIGYGGLAYGKGIRFVNVKKDDASPAVAPSEETVVNQTYPIWRYCYNYVNPQADRGEVAAYLKWIRTDEGQKLVKEVGYVPLPPQLREK